MAFVKWNQRWVHDGRFQHAEGTPNLQSRRPPLQNDADWNFEGGPFSLWDHGSHSIGPWEADVTVGDSPWLVNQETRHIELLGL